MITKRQLGFLFIAIGVLVIAGAIGANFIGGRDARFGPFQAIGIGGGVAIIVMGVSVIDLGLIREIHFAGGKTLVRMMLTTPFCPYAPQMMADVKQAAESAVPQPAEVEILADAWSPDMMPDPGLLGFSY